MGFQFQKGQAFVGTSTIDRNRQKMFLVVGRDGNQVSFAHVKDVIRERVEWCQETEIAKLKDADGRDYVLSARIPVDIDDAFYLVKLCK